MSKDNLISQELLHEIFEYRDGHLYWKNPKAKNIKSDRKAGSIKDTGYLRVGLFGKHFRVHRLIYLMFHGDVPKILDHINGNKLDNRIENLRPATSSQNNSNSVKQKRNTSGIKNVYWNKNIKKWTVIIGVDKKLKYFGSYDSIEEAAEVAKQKRNELHKEFARHE